MEGIAIHDRGEDFTAYIHQHDAVPFVQVRESSRLWDRNALALVPTSIVCIAFEECRNICIDLPLGSAILCFVRLWQDAIEARDLAICQRVDGSINLLEGDEGVKVKESRALGNVGKDG